MAVRSRLTSVARDCGARASELAADLARADHCAGLVYDLGPWAQDVAAQLRALRQQCPAIAVFAYAPTTVPGPVLQACAALPGVRIELHKPLAQERALLRQSIRWLLDAAPQLQLSRKLEILFPEAPPGLRSLLRAALDQVTDRAAIFSITVDDCATALGLGARTLERVCQRHHLPGPKRILLWIDFLYLMLVARLNRTPVIEAAGLLALIRK